MSLSKSEQSTSNKRAYVHTSPRTPSPTQKIAKIHPFFERQPEMPETSSFQWLDSLGSAKSCLHGVNLSPKSSTKVAAFDLDGTLIKYEFANKVVTPASSWEWWRASVPAKLKDAFESGYSIVIFSNQALRPQALKTWKLKIPSMAAALPDIPFRIFVSTAKDGYRKPMVGSWSELERMFREGGIEIDKTISFFVGDAAGRQYNGRRSDFSSTDRKWAHNVGINFFTPEEYFLQLPPHEPVFLPGFHVSSLPESPYVEPTPSPLLPTSLTQELVIFVGYPCLGKTSFYRRYFLPAGYVHINQDTLKTRDKCVKKAQEVLREGKNCVIDNTNRSAGIRKYYIDIAKDMKIPVRCFLFTGSIDLAWHNNLYRAYNLPQTVAAQEPKRELIPYIGFTSFRDNYEEPHLGEGLAAIQKINWVFEGSAEEKRYWSMWLQIDGK